MKIQLSEHFTYKKLLQFVFPSIIMMIFTSIYSVVDGLFVSNFVGKSAFAAVNLIMPFLMGISALGFMIGTGGSAIVAKTLGEGKIENANEYFSMLVYITAIGGIIIAILSMFLVKPVASFIRYKRYSSFTTAFYMDVFFAFRCLLLCCRMYFRAFL